MPAYGNTVISKSYDTLTAITKFRFVKSAAVAGTDNVGAKPQCTAITVKTDIPIGVAQENVTTPDIARGKGLPVMLEGISEVEINAASAVAVGDQIAIDAVGRGIKLGDAAAGAVVYGIAEQACTVTGNRIAVRLVR
ncbi:MAG TPA: DUF2190 family protein [Nitrospiraceae bacterium]